ncbi:GTPase [Streptomyces krungchingensis]|uniref:YfjP family GTPase n=1 Tax=Streptomyces krungchingensis TaxID=1565034 RepID=UPI003CE7F856
MTAVTDHTDHADRPGDDPHGDAPRAETPRGEATHGQERSGDGRPGDGRLGGDRPAGGHDGNAHDGESRGTQGRDGEARPAEAGPQEGRHPRDERSGGGDTPQRRGEDARPADARSGEARSADARSADARSAEARSADARAAGARSEEARSAGTEPSPARSEGRNPREARPEGRGTQEGPSQDTRADARTDATSSGGVRTGDAPAEGGGRPGRNRAGDDRSAGTAGDDAPSEDTRRKSTGLSKERRADRKEAAAAEGRFRRGAGARKPSAPGLPQRAPAGDGDGHARVNGDAESARADGDAVWDDGLIARRVTEPATAGEPPAPDTRPAVQAPPAPLAYDAPLRARLDALRELVGVSRARLDSDTLAEAGRVLDEAAARRKLSGQHTVVAIAGATGSGKSQLFNALAGVAISETGVRRPTTAAPIACSWSDGAATLIDRLGIPGRLRRRPLQSPEAEAQLRGLVLVDLPDHDSAAVQHREQVDRVLKLVDAVIWVVDPEKYADAVIHERYLRPMAGHAEVMFVVLNQVDRLPGEAAHQVLDDLRRLLDEDGIALGEHGEPGATVLALSALTGDGVGELREVLGQFVARRNAPGRRISADVDATARQLRPAYVTGRRVGLSEEARDEFSDRLADAVGAVAAGEAAERAWRRNANRACGTPWLRLWRWTQERRDPQTARLPVRDPADEEATARQRVEQAVRVVADRAAYGLPAPWALTVREAAARGAQGLPEALDEMAVRATTPARRPPRPGWWPVAVLAQVSMTILQVVGGLWLVAQIIGVMSPNLGVPVLLMVAGIVGGPLVEWGSRMAARGPARRYGQEAERRLREAATGCGRARVLDPLAAELLRYREVREEYGRVTGAAPASVG